MSKDIQIPSTAKIRELTLTEIKNVSGGKAYALVAPGHTSTGRRYGPKQKKSNLRAPIYHR